MRTLSLNWNHRVGGECHFTLTRNSGLDSGDHFYSQKSWKNFCWCLPPTEDLQLPLLLFLGISSLIGEAFKELLWYGYQPPGEAQ